MTADEIREVLSDLKWQVKHLSRLSLWAIEYHVYVDKNWHVDFCRRIPKEENGMTGYIHFASRLELVPPEIFRAVGEAIKHEKLRLEAHVRVASVRIQDGLFEKKPQRSLLQKCMQQFEYFSNSV